MSAEKAHLLGLIGLRALAERDQEEYRRVTDLPKGDLDDRIERLMKRVADPECSELYRQLQEAMRSQESQVEAEMLLEQVYSSGMQKSQYESVRASRQEAILPSDVIRAEAKRLRVMPKWDAIKANLDALDEMVMREEFPVPVLQGIAVVVQWLADDATFEADESVKKSVIWRTLTAILPMAHRQLSSDVTADDAWEHAYRKEAFCWLQENTSLESTSEANVPPSSKTGTKRKANEEKPAR